jgi:hypothetical protein
MQEPSAYLLTSTSIETSRIWSLARLEGRFDWDIKRLSKREGGNLRDHSAQWLLGPESIDERGENTHIRKDKNFLVGL